MRNCSSKMPCIPIFQRVNQAVLLFVMIFSSAYAIEGDEVQGTQTVDVMDLEMLDPETTGEWPENANGDLPLAGIFYGNHQTGVGAQNAGIGLTSSRRFRAEKTGQIEHVRYQNRVLTKNNIKSRCARLGQGSVWCDCQNAGLDEYTCGYTLGSSYSVGNGGTIVVELRPDDGTGLPSSTVLGKTNSFVPMDNKKVTFPKLTFDNPVSVEIGKLYHLVFTNLNPPTSCGYASVPVSQAGSCPRHQGAIGLNGVRLLNAPTTTGLRGPYRGNVSSANFYKRKPNSGWAPYTHSLSWYEVGYTDGVSVGEAYSALDSMGAAKQVISGNKLARQAFTVEDSTRVVDGVWVNFGHTKSANGASLSVNLKDSSGTTIATGTIQASEHCRARVHESTPLSGWCRDWGYTAFQEPVYLMESHHYTLELSTDSGGDFIVSGYEPMSYHGLKDRNYWHNAQAEHSSDGGANWNRWTGGDTWKRDLPVLFTIEGMPRQLH